MTSSGSPRVEVRFTGFGGQGMVVMGYILGRAATVHDGKNASMTQSYGPEARGGASSTQVVISNDPIFYPYVTEPSVMVGMSQEGYTKYRANLAKDGKLLIDEDLVTLAPDENLARVYRIPATRFAEELGRKIVANIVMLGFFSALTGLVRDESLRKAISEAVPRPTIDLNIKAYEKGRSHALAILQGSAVK
ncbi:MAG TPA: 2-oxoacid:acceptor oxidoreductase family protein [bacterium]|nr:2-oxoacid:acceptor oxidoreductase family protein [bacterium]